MSRVSGTTRQIPFKEVSIFMKISDCPIKNCPKKTFKKERK